MTSSNKSNSPRVQSEAPLTDAPAALTNSAEKQLDGPLVIRFASNDKPLGRTISYVIKQLRDGKQSVVLQASGLAMTKVVTVAGIARDRVGDVHQFCEFLAISTAKEGGPETTGIQITLSMADVDNKATEVVGYCEPLKKGFMMADMSESERKRFNARRKPNSAKNVIKPDEAAVIEKPVSAKNAKKANNAKNAAKTAEVKNDKSVKAAKAIVAEPSKPERDAQAKPSKRQQTRDKKKVADEGAKAVEVQAKDEASQGEQQQKPKQKRRYNKKEKDDENMPPVSVAKADPKTPLAAEKKSTKATSGEDSARDHHRPQNKDTFYTGGQGTRRGHPHPPVFYENYRQDRYYDNYHAGHHPGYYGQQQNSYSRGSPQSSSGYQQREPFVHPRGGNTRQMYPRYQQEMAYPGAAMQRGRGRGSYGYGNGRNTYMGDPSGNNMSGQRSSASYRDEVLDQSTIKREVGTRSTL